MPGAGEPLARSCSTQYTIQVLSCSRLQTSLSSITFSLFGSFSSPSANKKEKREKICLYTASCPLALRVVKFRPGLRFALQVIACFLPAHLTHNAMLAYLFSSLVAMAFYSTVPVFEMRWKRILPSHPREWENYGERRRICQQYVRRVPEQRPVYSRDSLDRWDRSRYGLNKVTWSRDAVQACLKQSGVCLCSVQCLCWLGAKPISSFLPSPSAGAHGFQEQLPFFLLSCF